MRGVFALSLLGYASDFALVPLAAILLTLRAASELDTAELMNSLLIGVLSWTLAEYWIHRSVLHGDTRFAAMHREHHESPRDLIGVPSWITMPTFAIAGLALSFLFGAALGAALLAGVLAGYLFYCGVHAYFHHGHTSRHHAAHHRGYRGNYGVSSPLWDIVFGTHQR